MQTKCSSQRNECLQPDGGARRAWILAQLPTTGATLAYGITALCHRLLIGKIRITNSPYTGEGHHNQFTYTVPGRVSSTHEVAIIIFSVLHAQPTNFLKSLIKFTT